MPHYKDPRGDLHFLSETDIAAGGLQLLPAGCEPISDAQAKEILAQMKELTQDQIEATFTAAIQLRLDAFAHTRNYDNILSACTYATSAIPKFRDEGQACVNLRDATWAAAYAILAKVQAGQHPMPTSLADIEADLPALEWPQ